MNNVIHIAPLAVLPVSDALASRGMGYLLSAVETLGTSYQAD